MKIFRLFVAITLISFALSPAAHAVVPAPDGGYPGGNTAEGADALFSLTTGVGNTAIGRQALRSNTTGGSNTANGFQALYNTNSDDNVANGSQALYKNTTGFGNAANGFQALYSNTSAYDNTANGDSALYSNTIGIYNTANGYLALYSNTSGYDNTATGSFALSSNTIGIYNTADGLNALLSNTTGGFNTATGNGALPYNTTGSFNTAIGHLAGNNLTTGSGNVCIGDAVYGVAGESNTTRIRNIYSSVASGRAVYVDADNKIGTLASTRRVKNDIKPMDKASEAVLALKPVSFRYKKEIDASGTLQFGLVAEEVADIDADLVTRDSEGKPETVRYEAVNAMLLNEFLKEHRTVQELKSVVAKQEAANAQQQKQIEALTAGLQKVSAQLEVSKPASQTVVTND